MKRGERQSLRYRYVKRKKRVSYFVYLWFFNIIFFLGIFGIGMFFSSFKLGWGLFMSIFWTSVMSSFLGIILYNSIIKPYFKEDKK